ncbi:MAG: efflux RND transporter periplasmic adaptor subunit [Planctomycetales bacterium]|nr:efflux RND transporter periplasmic adaptor subunit [Planctomycetales bacterium]
MSESQLDLSRLALDRSPQDASRKRPRRRRWVSRYVLPAGILLGFIALLGAAAGRQLLPTPSVTVVPVIVKRGVVQQAGTPLFQAAGWIEPRPTSVSVAALAPGVVEELLVVEGQQVARGEAIARLIAIDAELGVQQAKAALKIREGELQRAQAELKAAVTRLEQPVHLKARLADAESLLAKAKTEMEKLPFLIKAAKANVKFTQSSLEGKQSAKNAIAGVIIEQAVKDHAAAQADLEELQQRGPNLQREIKALQEKVDSLKTQLDLLVEERRQVEEARAKVVSSTAIRDEAKLQLRQAELMLERTVIRSPMDGRVLRLVALPGSRVMGLEDTAGQSSSTVIEMYDPKRLQVRADVRLEDVPMVTQGAPVEIETASSGKSIKGRVLQSTSSANIQKNTLEVKVELVDPPSTVSPEMLVTATFVAPKLETESDESKETERVFVPQQLVQSDDSGAAVWVVDADNRAIRMAIQVGGSGPDGLVEIIEGLNATDKLIASGVDNLNPGDAVTIRGEDQAIGVGR